MYTHHTARRLLALLLLLICLPCAQAAAGNDTDSGSTYATVIKNNVMLRDSPSSTGSNMGRVPINTRLQVIGEKNDGTYTWYRVMYMTFIPCYIRGDMVRLDGAQQSSVPTASPTPRITPSPKPTATPKYASDKVQYTASTSDAIWNSDALKTFMDSWYGYYNHKGVRFSCVTYNFHASKEAEYAQIKDGVRHSISQAYAGATPVYISVQYFLSSSNAYLFQITDTHLTEIPQNLTILFEGKSLEPFSVECNEYGVHTFRFRQNDIFSIINAIANGGAMTLSYDTDQGTVNVEVSRKSTPLFAEMLELSYHCYQYCNEKSDRYLDKYLLQGHVKPTPTPETAKYYTPEHKKIMSTLTGIPEYMLGHIFKKGDSSSTIYNIKLKMQELGYYRVDASLSNAFNDIMVERVKQFQKRNGLKETGVINEEVLKKMYGKDAKLGSYYGQKSQSSPKSSSGSSSSKSSSKKSGGHWEWQWRWVWRYQTCFNTSRDCSRCHGTGSYNAQVKEKVQVWVPD